jgi:formate/nitrite transporter FocA (FNT family)
MLCLIFVTLLIGAAILCGVPVVRTLRAQKSRGKLLLFVLLTVCAVAVGIRYGVLHVFELSERYRLQGIPIPLVMFVNEDGRWTDFVIPTPVAYYCMVGNVLAPVLVLWAAWLLGGRLWRLKVKGGREAAQQSGDTTT